MAQRDHIEWIVVKDRFPQISSELNRMARRVENETAETWRDAAKEVLYPGHGEVTGFLKDHIIAEGNEVRSEADYSGPVNDGHGSFPGYGFWDQGEMEAQQYFEDAIWRETKKAIERGL